MTLTVTLEKRITIDIPMLGILQEPKKEELEALNLDYGLQLQELSEANIEDWKSDGVFKGSMVTEINDISINSISEAQTALETYNNRVLRLSIVKINGEKVVYRFR